MQGDGIGVQVALDAGGGVSVARPLPQSIPVEYLMDAVTASEHPDPDPRLVESNAKNPPEFGRLLLLLPELIFSPSRPTRLHCLEKSFPVNSFICEDMMNCPT